MNILRATEDPKLFGPWFRNRETWQPWLAFVGALFGLPLDDVQHAIYRACTGRDTVPTEAASEAWLICGRRAGKSFVLALIGVYLAVFKDYRQFLAPGERATILIIATDRRQARVILRYVTAMLTQIPFLNAMVLKERAMSVDLKVPVSIEVGTASFRTSRGYTFAAILADEMAFWPNEDSAEPDFAVLDAVRPGMLTIPTAMLLCASSPYARRGALWDAYRRWYGKEDAPLVWKASTRTMNPTVSQSFIDRAYERDAESAEAEYGAEFRSDISQLLSREAVAKVVANGVTERGFISGTRYVAFVDPSGGSADSMTLAIGHREGEDAIVDVIREIRPPFSPESTVDEFCTLLKAYQVRQVTGDRYAGEWPREQFRKRGVTYELAEKAKSDLYRELLPAINSQQVKILDVPRLINQLVGLERRTSRGGRDSIDHAPGAHDDVANAVAGLLSLLVDGPQPTVAMFLSSRHRPSSSQARAA